jgi:hypothetical protein
MFGAKQTNGWKVSINEFVIAEDCKALLKLYEDFYAHPRPNDDYPSVFFMRLVSST